MKIDDPVSSSSVHGVAGIWSIIAIGLFAEDVTLPLSGTAQAQDGLFLSGNWTPLGIQCLGALCYILWGFIMTYILLFFVDKIYPLRMTEEHELIGGDIAEHGVEYEEEDCCCRCKEVEKMQKVILNELKQHQIDVLQKQTGMEISFRNTNEKLNNNYFYSEKL